jgi:hypothetical protein
VRQNRLTVMAMVNYLENEMEMLMDMGMPMDEQPDKGKTKEPRCAPAAPRTLK